MQGSLSAASALLCWCWTCLSCVFVRVTIRGRTGTCTRHPKIRSSHSRTEPWACILITDRQFAFPAIVIPPLCFPTVPHSFKAALGSNTDFDSLNCDRSRLWDSGKAQIMITDIYMLSNPCKKPLRRRLSLFFKWRISQISYLSNATFMTSTRGRDQGVISTWIR